MNYETHFQFEQRFERAKREWESILYDFYYGDEDEYEEEDDEGV